MPNKAIPDVPLLTKYVKNPKDLAALKILGVNEDVGRPHMFPPGVPQYLLTALRTAFDATMTDPKFLAEAEKRQLTVIAPLTGEAAEAMVANIYKAPPDVVAEAKRITGE